MSISRTLNRLVAEVRREARRNPEFAARLDGVLRAHVWRGAAGEQAAATPPEAPAKETVAPAAACDLNPVALFTREGADALKATLAALSAPALAHMVGEHHLDPAGATEGLAKDELVAHIVAQARKRVERDRKMFEY